MDEQSAKTKIDSVYRELCDEPSDINEHLPTLKEYADQCEVVAELGVRGMVSTWSFLNSDAKVVRSVDIRHPDTYFHMHGLEYVTRLAAEAGKDFQFVLGNTLELNIADGFVDMIFIDTLHQYEQLRRELALLGNKANKFLGFHDTTLYGEADEVLESPFPPGGPGLWRAIEEFMAANPHWVVERRDTNNNGLTILRRKNDEVTNE